MKTESRIGSLQKIVFWLITALMAAAFFMLAPSVNAESADIGHVKAARVADETLETVKTTIEPAEGSHYQFYSQKALAANADGSWKYRIVCVMDWEWLQNADYTEIQLIFGSSVAGESDKVLKTKPQTVFKSIFGIMDGKRYEYVAKDGYVLLGWIMQNAPAQYAPKKGYIYTEAYTDGLAYEINDLGTAYTVSGIGSAADSDIVIPPAYKGFPVTAIGDGAFCDCVAMTGVTIPDSVTTVGDFAFDGCRALETVTGGKGMTHIGEFAFAYCTSLTDIFLPEGLQEINRALFFGCTSLKQPILKNGLKAIKSHAFYGCRSFEEIIVPDSVEVIERFAFSGCDNLKSMTLPFVGEKRNGTDHTHFGYIFGSGSYANNGTYLPKQLEHVTVTGGRIDDHAFHACKTLVGVTLSESITVIGAYAFFDCSALSTITMNGRVREIRSTAFAYCTSLTSVRFSVYLTAIGKNAFYGCQALSAITFDGSESAWHVIAKGENWDMELPSYTVSFGNQEIEKMPLDDILQDSAPLFECTWEDLDS